MTTLDDRPAAALVPLPGSKPRPGFPSTEIARQCAVIFMAEGFTSDEILDGAHPQDELLGELADAIDLMTAEGFTLSRCRKLVGLGEVPVPLTVTPVVPAPRTAPGDAPAAA